MSKFTKAIQEGKIPVKYNTNMSNGSYGSIAEFDKLVDSTNVSDRVKAANMGYGLSKLMDDTNQEVLSAVMRYHKMHRI